MKYLSLVLSFCCFSVAALFGAHDEVLLSERCANKTEGSPEAPQRHAGFKRARDYSYGRRVRRRISGQNANSVAVQISVADKTVALSSEAARESGVIASCMLLAKDNDVICTMEFLPLFVNPELLGDIAGFLHAFAAERSYAERIGGTPNFAKVYRANVVVFFEDELESLLRAAHYLQIEPLVTLLRHDKDVSRETCEKLGLACQELKAVSEN